MRIILFFAQRDKVQRRAYPKSKGQGCLFLVRELTKKEETLKIVVCVKQVPDSAAKVTAENGRPSWGDAPLVINPWDEYAVEMALRQQEAQGGSVTAISVGGESAKEALKHALAMGCSEAILITDPGLGQADTQAVAKVLAAAIKKVGEGEPVDLAVFGRQAIDSDMGVAASQAARILGWPSLNLVSAVQALDASARTIKVEKTMEEGRQTVEGRLPAVMSVVKDIGEPRYPSFMGIRKASRASIPVWSLADLGIEAPKSHVTWPEMMAPPARDVNCEFIQGSSAVEVAEKLADKIMAEKVL
jgi:electron transfer flavoprotein beta subunit